MLDLSKTQQRVKHCTAKTKNPGKNSVQNDFRYDGLCFFIFYISLGENICIQCINGNRNLSSQNSLRNIIVSTKKYIQYSIYRVVKTSYTRQSGPSIRGFTGYPVHHMDCTDPSCCRTVMEILFIKLAQRAVQDVCFTVPTLNCDAW